jgi:TRAP-type C4-dicarboxylate transport system permease large subunit
MLMGLSVSIGGMVERADLMSMVPAIFDSTWTAMLALVLVMVLIGMFMDPYGAVILVSATIASVAYKNGIDPVHFWMVALVAFELGYLSPPVALNHLLTRQVVGEEEIRLAKEESAGMSFWYRHERILLPLACMGAALLIVAFVPLWVGYQ